MYFLTVFPTAKYSVPDLSRLSALGAIARLRSMTVRFPEGSDFLCEEIVEIDSSILPHSEVDW
jgi:hypothetical protein